MVIETEGALVEIRAPEITTQAIQNQKNQIRMLENMIADVLKREIDFGRIPGTPADSLWDPGASKIFGAFNCYAGERKILKFEDTPEKISICFEVPIISRATGNVVATGIGAASTLETKYKYRWVENPKEFGFDDTTIGELKTKEDRGKFLYRIQNPEHSELLNSIVKMASKRAEVDAAESLPGVASVLREMFTGRKPTPTNKANNGIEDWTNFWSQTRRLGLLQPEVHRKLGVNSMKEWLAQGKTLEQAIITLSGKIESDQGDLFDK